jgi:uncharacterized protein YjiS (DUF1127 family)
MLLPAQQQEHPMPPQQTNLRSEPGRKTARLRLVVPSVEGAAGGAFAAAFPDASTTAPREAFPWNVLSLLQRCWRALQERRRRERLRISLHDLSDRALEDIGLAQGNIDYIVAHRAMEKLRDGTGHLWPSRGVV